ncbi:MAG: DNA recombination protein RmuC [Chthoniobacteraceae bacterium]
MTITILVAAAVVLLVVLLLRKPGDSVRVEVDRLGGGLREELRHGREEGANAARQLREEIAAAIRGLGDSISERLGDTAKQQIDHLQTFSTALTDSSERSEQRLAEMRTTLDERLTGAAEAAQQTDAQTRQELQTALKSFSELLAGQLQELSQMLKQQLSELTTRNEAKLEAMRVTVETKLAQVQTDNEAKLERIRATVDEKLHQTLEQRLGESFRLVSERLEQVHAGLGEMKSLAVGVGDLRKILSNVRTRGTWGEVQLGNLLEQTLTPDQFTRNFAPNEATGERVEFAIKLPGRDTDGTPVWLPLDSKFPQEEYQRLLDAQERADAPAAEAAGVALEQGIRLECRKISEKYLLPPITTDFGILFVPTEGLFAELLRRPGLIESLQRDLRVVVSGPTTLTALLTSLQMGFRTLAIEQRSSEVWKVLGAVKTEFGKFGDALDKVQKKLTEASNSIETAQRRQRAVVRKLRPADGLPAPEAVALLGIDSEPDEPQVEEEPDETSV